MPNDYGTSPRPEPAVAPCQKAARMGLWRLVGVVCLSSLAALACSLTTRSSDAAFLPVDLPFSSSPPVLLLAETSLPGKTLVLDNETETTRSTSFYAQQELSLTPLPLGIFWGEHPLVTFTPPKLAKLHPETKLRAYLKERSNRVAISRQDAQRLVKTNASFQYAIRQIMDKRTLKDKVFVTERLANQFRYFSEPTRRKNGTLVPEDHWMTPSQFLDPKYGGYSGGDCEDFAIYKYTLLEHAGVDPGQMKIVGLQIPTKKRHQGPCRVDGGRPRREGYVCARQFKKSRAKPCAL